MKYLGQRDRYSCAAIAFLNAFKWMGIATSRRQIASVKDILGTTYPSGTSRRNVAWLCKDAGFKRLRKPTIEKMDAELIAGNALIVETQHGKRKGHAYLIVRRTEHYFVCVNVFRGQTVSRVSKKQIERLDFNNPVVHRVKPLELGPNLIFYSPKTA